ncbi:Hypothetical protein EPM1_3238 [Stenotrophomonas maltophilia EPM1]|nr:Hypothetical protein EPM1_3238 [Stenotrophomonas maltophilia EPM1]
MCGTAGPITTVVRPRGVSGRPMAVIGGADAGIPVPSHTARNCAVAACLRQDSDRSRRSNGGIIPCPFCPFM